MQPPDDDATDSGAGSSRLSSSCGLVAVCRGCNVQVTMDDGTSVLSNAQYMSSTSGGSWFNAAFSYEVRRHDSALVACMQLLALGCTVQLHIHAVMHHNHMRVV
jgi:hypothetical protein